MNGARVMFEPTAILEVGQWDKDDASKGDYIRVQFNGDQETRRYVLDRKHVKAGDEPKVGTVVSMEAYIVQKAKAINGQNGPRVIQREQVRVVRLDPAA